MPWHACATTKAHLHLVDVIIIILEYLHLIYWAPIDLALCILEHLAPFQYCTGAPSTFYSSCTGAPSTFFSIVLEHLAPFSVVVLEHLAPFSVLYWST